MMKLNRIATVAALVAIAASRTAGAQIVTNGGFELGDGSNTPTGWTISVGDPFQSFFMFRTCDDFVGPIHGGSCAMFGGATDGLGYLRQTVMTNAGSHYTLSFYLANDPYSFEQINFDSEFSASLGGSTMFHLVNSGITDYQHYQADYLATNSSTQMEFAFHNGTAGYFALDDVSMTEVTPEPATLLFVATGMFGMLGFARRRPPRL